MNNFRNSRRGFKTMGISLLVCVASCSLAACDDTSEKLSWSPDGTKLAVLGGDGLHLSAPDGSLSASLLAPAVKQVIWTSSDTAYVLRAEPFKSAEDLIALAGPKDGPGIQARSEKLLKDLIDCGGDMDKVEKMPPEQGLLLVNYLALHDSVKLEKALGGGDKASLFIENSSQPHVAVISRCKFRNGQATISDTLLRRIETIEQMRLSPDGQYLIYGNEKHHLHLLATTAGVAALGADSVFADHEVISSSAYAAEWSPNGHDIVYFSPYLSQSGKDGLESSLSELRCTSVRDVSGAPIDRNTTVKEGPEGQGDKRRDDCLARVYKLGSSRICCLKNGAVLFSGGQSFMPARPDDPAAGNLFVIRGNGPITPLLSPSERVRLNGNLYFVPSPDQGAIAVQGGDGLIDVVSLASNETSQIDLENFLPAKNALTYPSWRNNDELTFEATPAQLTTTPAAASQATKKAGQKSALKKTPAVDGEAEAPARQVISWSLRDRSWRRLDSSWPKSLFSGN